jgi:3-dehydroquinate synthase
MSLNNPARSTVAPTLTVTLPRQAYQYPIYIQPGVLGRPLASQWVRQALPTAARLLVVTHEPLWALHGQPLLAQLQQAGFAVTVFAVPQGEPTKQLSWLQAVWQAAQQAGLTRQDGFLAFGGGVIGDLTGFAASAYYRGLPFVQVPTTLLAQVDSSVGGKTGINCGPVKNSIGAFYQPKLVIIDPQVLATLPHREWTAGLAEVAKYGLIEAACTGQAEIHLWPLLTQCADREAVVAQCAALVGQCCRIKASVVQQDEFEQTGLRALLNLGHTFGHALEADGEYTTYLHGEAVAIGTWWACVFAHQHDTFTPLQAVQAVWQQLGLPTAPWGNHQPERLLKAMQQDKKNKAQGGIMLVLPQDPLGHAWVAPGHRDKTVLAFLQQQLALAPNHIE